jgi:pyrimidine-nucleoside phosphorylase
MTIVDVIRRKRDGQKHSREELTFVSEAAAGKQDVDDYQLSAWLMAAYLNGLDDEETLWLTLAMASSGERLDLSSLPKPWMDKHSTGGVGDKTTLVLLPLLSACGLTMVKMSGRGLGITGGTIDKLESIPGFRTNLSSDEMLAQAAEIGLAITGQSPNLAPADKTLYALRDTTATVNSIPLIVASILSKKIAGGADHLVLDVKCGSGAFMPDLASARTLGTKLREIATMAGIRTAVAITDMSQPLGRFVGNALEVREAFEVLNKGVGRFASLCVDLAAEALVNVGIAREHEEGALLARQALESGTARERWDRWIVTQTGDKNSGEDVLANLPKSPITHEVLWDGEPGWLSRIDAGVIGQAVVDLGGGRRQKGDKVNPSVGIELGGEIGTRVEKGQALATIHARTESELKTVIPAVTHAFAIEDHAISPLPALIEWLE